MTLQRLGASLHGFSLAMRDRRYEEDVRVLRDSYARYLVNLARQPGMDPTGDQFMPRVQEFVDDRMAETMHGYSWLDRQRYGGRFRALAAETVMSAWEYQDGMKAQQAQIAANEQAAEAINQVQTGNWTYEEAKTNLSGIQNPVFRDQALQRLSTVERERGLTEEILDFSIAADERLEVQERGLAANIGQGLRELETNGSLNDDVKAAIEANPNIEGYRQDIDNYRQRWQSLKSAQSRLLEAQNELVFINGATFEEGLFGVQEAAGRWADWTSGDEEVDREYLGDLQELVATQKYRLNRRYNPSKTPAESDRFLQSGDIASYYRDIQALSEGSMGDTITEKEIIAQKSEQARLKWDKVQTLRAQSRLITEGDELRETLQDLEQNQADPGEFRQVGQGLIDQFGEGVIGSLPAHEQEVFRPILERQRSSLQGWLADTQLSKINNEAALASEKIFNHYLIGVENGSIQLEDALAGIPDMVRPLPADAQAGAARDYREALLSPSQVNQLRAEYMNPGASIGGAHPTLRGQMLGFMQSISDAPEELIDEMKKSARLEYPRDPTWIRSDMKQQVVLWSALSDMYYKRTNRDLFDDMSGAPEMIRRVYNEFTNWTTVEGERWDWQSPGVYLPTEEPTPMFPNLKDFWDDQAAAGETGQDAFVRTIQVAMADQKPLALSATPYDDISPSQRRTNDAMAIQQANRARTAQRQQREGLRQERLQQEEKKIREGVWDEEQPRPVWADADEWARLQTLNMEEQRKIAAYQLFRQTGVLDAETEYGREVLEETWRREGGNAGLQAFDAPEAQMKSAQLLGILAQSGRLPTSAKTLVNALIASTDPRAVTAGLRAATSVFDISQVAFNRDLPQWTDMVSDFRAERRRVAMGSERKSEAALVWAVNQHMQRRQPEFAVLAKETREAIQEEMSLIPMDSVFGRFGFDDVLDGTPNPNYEIQAQMRHMAMATAFRKGHMMSAEEAAQTGIMQLGDIAGPNAIGEDYTVIQPLTLQEIDDPVQADEKVRNVLRTVLRGTPELPLDETMLESVTLGAEYYLQREATRPGIQLTKDPTAFRIHYDVTGDGTYVDSGALVYFKPSTTSVNEEQYWKNLQDGMRPEPPSTMTDSQVREAIDLNVSEDEAAELFRRLDESGR